eukprot:TRINITY_DN32209_c0_g1_i1.p1 TRINITY_DN32209_c0_g1~~TRINITY_DN32209_c0_g1_i1.p1  ORF type:complete len:227 (-),score=42.61 TRINITY_DN32209_c0_g1_i1:10-690(-)
MAMLYFNKQVPRLQRNGAERKWEKFVMGELAGATVGFVGFGDIAQSTARLCKAFGMRILALRNRRPGKGEPRGDSSGANNLADVVYYSEDDPARLELWRQADFVVCSLPGGQGTLKFCGEAQFGAMKKTAVFISLGRGTAVDEAALSSALDEGRLAGAALDVFFTEPLPDDSRLWRCDNVLLSSHNADLTANYMDRTWTLFMDRLRQYKEPSFRGFGAGVDLAKGY